MKLVVDTNILFSFFWKDSFTRKLLMSKKFDLISPKISLEEIKRHSKEIIKKTDTNKKSFVKYYNELKKFVRFIDRKYYSIFLKKANEISPDKADSHFFALCFKDKCPLWSNDSLLKKQNNVLVLSTEEIIKLI